MSVHFEGKLCCFAFTSGRRRKKKRKGSPKKTAAAKMRREVYIKQKHYYAMCESRKGRSKANQYFMCEAIFSVRNT